MNEIIIIKNVRCRLDSEGNPEFNLEDVARGLGLTKTDIKLSETGFRKEYIRIDWPRVYDYLMDLGVAASCNDELSYRERCPEYIPEYIFYRLAMKAKNEAAEKFQDIIAREVVPAIRKHGMYATPKALEAMLEDPDTMIQTLQALKAEQEKRKALEADNSRLTVENKIMAPKADYFDVLVDCNVLTGIRETAKELGVKQTIFVNLLLGGKYMYRDKKGKLQPYAQHVVNGLFELKECANEKTGWGGTQPFITPKGRETFMRLLQGISA